MLLSLLLLLLLQIALFVCPRRIISFILFRTNLIKKSRKTEHGIQGGTQPTPLPWLLDLPFTISK